MLTALVVIGMTWVGVRKKKIKEIVVWGLLAAFVVSLVSNLHRLWPTEFIAAEFHRTGNIQPYLVWNVKYFFIDFIPTIIATSILVLSASIAARSVHVRFGKPRWVGILCGIVVAVVLLIPAFFVGIFILGIFIPGSWP